MNPNRLRAVARRLATAPRTREPPTTTDAELLGGFLDQQDESAFGELVARHLPSVRAVCRTLLRDPNDVDDAVQAAFLILVRRAATVRDARALGGWLYRVAWRVANRLRAKNARRAAPRQVGIDPDSTPAPAVEPAGGAEAFAALHEEVSRLPERYRLAVIACYAGGTPTAEAAKRLGWPKGTLLTRLAWARKRLRERLGKRGITLAGGFTAAFGGRAGVTGAAVLAGIITRVAVPTLSNDPQAKELVSERVSSLTEGVLRTMTGTKLKVAAGLVLVAVTLLGMGIGRFTAGAADGARPTDKKPVPAAKPADGPPAANAPAGKSEVAEAAPAGPGNDLVIRRPHGSYTKEVNPFGRATITFTEDRIHVVANIRIEKATFTVTADADYSINRESMVYGIITSVEVTGPFDEDEAAEIAILASAANDMPFAFRIRTDDDAITIKDIRFGALGSPAFTNLIGELSSDDEELMILTGLASGKYKADPNPERNAPLPPPRGNQPNPVPKPKKNAAAGRAYIGAGTGLPSAPGACMGGAITAGPR
ncbi:MAG TPA: RNA polymerase sigma factor [Gemmataceae bacterium]|nr:RNA polymerase sigma factor [Gemmataceae bacterium]